MAWTSTVTAATVTTYTVAMQLAFKFYINFLRHFLSPEMWSKCFIAFEKHTQCHNLTNHILSQKYIHHQERFAPKLFKMLPNSSLHKKVVFWGRSEHFQQVSYLSAILEVFKKVCQCHSQKTAMYHKDHFYVYEKKAWQTFLQVLSTWSEQPISNFEPSYPKKKCLLQRSEYHDSHHLQCTGMKVPPTESTLCQSLLSPLFLVSVFFWLGLTV